MNATLAMTHECAVCTGSRTRRALRLLLQRLPNITNTKAAAELDINRPYISALRKEMEAAGCTQKRVADGRAVGLRERAARNARSWSNTDPREVRPLITSLPGEIEHLRMAHGPRSTWGYPIGSWWTP